MFGAERRRRDMTDKMNRMMIISLIMMLLCAGIFLPVRQFVPEKYIPGSLVSSALISSDFRDLLPEMVTQEKGIITPLALVPSSVQSPWRILTFFFLKFIERIFAVAAVTRIGFICSFICICILWIPSTTSHKYIISYIKHLPVTGQMA